MKIKYIYLFFFFVILGFLGISAFTSNPEDEKTPNIKFSHSLHVEITDCASCHTAVAESTELKSGLLPNHDNCSVCHDVEDEKTCTTCHLNGNYEGFEEKESKVYFNHSFHLNDQKLQCDNCHKGFAEVDYSFQAAQPFPIMENCYSCHNGQTAASNACENCHISTVNLIPENHKAANFSRAHKFDASALNANCVMCHDNSSCQECHVGTTMITEANNPVDFYQPYVPNNFTDGVKQQQITRVHELNYRFIHGIDSKGKTSECQTCHQIETFCGECHQSENSDFAFTGIVPSSHLKNNFTTIGVGTGGGEHSILARRDIESCVSCHDVQGADPTCITCHTDTDGIKGTNPKTHPSGFMSDTHGDWHDNQASVCYNCHTTASPSTPPGVGFCGYCHGSDGGDN